MNKTNFKIIIIAIISGVLTACGSGGAVASSSPATTVISVAIAESNLIPEPNKLKISINVISHALYKESLNEYETYETGESFTIKATLVESATITIENKIKLVTNNTDLIYESNECIINSSGYCDINVTIAESANLGESSLFITSNTSLAGTTELKFKIVAGNMIFFTDKDQRSGNFAIGYESANQAADAWCQSYAENKAPLSDRYRKKHYKGMIYGNPATISGKVYYRDDAKIKVATATGGYLAESLDNSVIDTFFTTRDSYPRKAWTGAGGIHNCMNWTATTFKYGRTGYINHNVVDSEWWEEKPVIRPCGMELGIYCVSQ